MTDTLCDVIGHEWSDSDDPNFFQCNACDASLEIATLEAISPLSVWGEIKRLNIEGKSFLVCDEENRYDKAIGIIDETYHLFDPRFLEELTDIPAEMFECTREQLLNANRVFSKAIQATCGIGKFSDAAIKRYGINHFIGFDGQKEHTIHFGNQTLYVYRWDD